MHVDNFTPAGNGNTTVNIAVTASSQTLALPTVGQQQADCYLLNVGTQTVFVRFDGGTASVSTSMPLGAGSVTVVTLGQGVTTLGVIAASTGSTLYATVGQGS